MKLLDHDPAIDGTESAPEPEALFPEAKRRQRRRWLAGISVVLLVIGSAIGAVVAAGGSAGRKPNAHHSGAGRAEPFASTSERGAIAVAHLRDGAYGVAVSSGSVWVGGNGVVQRIDPRTGRVLVRIRTRFVSGLSELAAGDGAIWATAGRGAFDGHGLVYRINPLADKVTARVSIAGNLEGVAAGGGYVAVAVMNGGVVEISAVTNRVVHRLRIANNGTVAFGLGSFWLTEPRGTSLFEVKASTGVIRINTLGATVFPQYAPAAGGIAVVHGEVWVLFTTYPNSPIIAGFDLRNGHQTAERTIPRAEALVADGRSILVLLNARSSDPTLFYPIRDTARVIRLDTRSGRELGNFVINALQPYAIAVGAGGIWVTDFEKSNLLRIRSR